jgi:hypothetical protein
MKKTRSRKSRDTVPLNIGCTSIQNITQSFTAGLACISYAVQFMYFNCQILYLLNKGNHETRTRKNIFTSGPIIFCGSVEHFFYVGGPFTEYAMAAKWIEKVGKYYNEECRYDIIITSRVQV